MQHENPLLALVLPVLLQNYLCIMLGKVGLAGRAGWYFNALKQTSLRLPPQSLPKSTASLCVPPCFALVFGHVIYARQAASCFDRLYVLGEGGAGGAGDAGRFGTAIG